MSRKLRAPKVIFNESQLLNHCAHAAVKEVDALGKGLSQVGLQGARSRHGLRVPRRHSLVVSTCFYSKKFNYKLCLFLREYSLSELHPRMDVAHCTGGCSFHSRSGVLDGLWDEGAQPVLSSSWNCTDRFRGPLRKYSSKVIHRVTNRRG